MKEKLRFLKEGLQRNHLRFKWQDPHLSHLEGIFSKGDRNLSQALAEAHRLGCRFDGWSDQFHYSLWREAFGKVGLEMDLCTQKKSFEDPLPWSLIDTGVQSKSLWEEYQKGLKEEVSPPCMGKDCLRCGVCNGEGIRVREGHPIETETQERREKGRNQKKTINKKVRLRFRKVGEIRFLSHLELAQLFYRASRRADLPLCFSEGFHPMPKIIFATALPVGVESLAEVVDMELEGRIPAGEVMERLNQMLPQGIQVIGAEEVLLSSSPSYPPHRSVYWISLDHLLSKEEAFAKVKKALDQEEFLVHQKRKEENRIVDVRPLIEKMDVKGTEEGLGEASGWGIELILRNVGGRRAKPSEIIEAIMGWERNSFAQFKVIKLE
jgi:radical SAM-linked protein